MMDFKDKNAASFTLHTCKQLSGDVKISYSLEMPPCRCSLNAHRHEIIDDKNNPSDDKDHDPRPGYCH